MAGIDPQSLDIHALRYTFITRLIMSGANPKIVQQLAGHKHISMTMDIYTQVDPEKEKEEILKLDFNPPTTKNQIDQANPQAG